MSSEGAVVVGDTMRMSVELIRQLSELPDRSSLLVRVKEIRTEADGSKTLVMDSLPMDYRQ